jgi:hypothetical protein
MRFRDIVRVMLAEATKYDAMFGEIVRLAPQVASRIESEINWAREVLKREDRIIWFLRIARLNIVRAIESTGVVGQNPEHVKQVEILAKKYTAQLAKVMGRPVTDRDLISTRILQGTLSHYLSLPVASIQNFQFTNQGIDDLETTLVGLEKVWKREQEEKAQHVPPQDGDKILIQFPDGWAWWLLNRGACDAEAKAMGHCGNVPSERQGDHLLSLRKEGPKGWRPSLTFILNGDGKLGEMKGRGNDKPAPQFHPYIIKLLENPIIKGIRGGGYLPEHNFKITDLTPEEQTRLADLKPSLASASYILKKFGPTEAFVQKVTDDMERDFEEYGREIPPWNPELNVFVVESFKDVDAFVREYGSDSLKNVNRVLEDGGEYYDYNVSDSDAKDLYDDLPPEVLQKIEQYAQTTYGEDENYEDIDWEDHHEVWDVLTSESDDILDAVRWGYETGLRYGAEHEMFNDYQKVLREAWHDTDADYLAMHYTMHRDAEGKDHIQVDQPCSIVISPHDMADIIDKGLLDEIGDQGWTNNATVDITEPHYGWSGYDESAAKEDALERLSEFIQ